MLGISHSEETKKKISEAHKGKKKPWAGKYEHNPLSEDHKKKIADGLKGRSVSVETREKIRNSLLGHKNAVGDKNGNWKGGISCEPYCEVWVDKEFKNWLKYERDGGKCQNPRCNGITTKLCLHHINYVKKDCRPQNLISLCNSCNARANFNRKYWERFYNRLVEKFWPVKGWTQEALDKLKKQERI